MRQEVKSTSLCWPFFLDEPSRADAVVTRESSENRAMLYEIQSPIRLSNSRWWIAREVGNSHHPDYNRRSFEREALRDKATTQATRIRSCEKLNGCECRAGYTRHIYLNGLPL